MKIIVLDTETLGLQDRQVYDLGWLVYVDGKVVSTKDYIIKQVYDDETKMNSAYYKKKLPIYEQRLADGYCKKVYWGNAIRYLLKDMEGVDGIYAYNSKFDERAIADTCAKFNAKFNPTADGIKDIMDEIDSIVQTEAYANFCRANGLLTKHKPPREQKKAETLYRYLTGQTDYEEQHTALEDSKIELDILLHALGLA